MHHLARRTSLVGRQPEALRRRGGRKDGGWREGREKKKMVAELEGAGMHNNRWELRVK